MTGKRFECYDLIFDGFIKDTLTNENIVEPIKLIHLLNEQQATINELKEENKKLIEEWEFSFRTEMAHHRFEEKELKEKIRKQQSTITELNKQNEQLKQKIQRWKTLYEIKDKEVTARVDSLNKVCEYYTSEVLFKSDVDPNKAVKEVINRILNTEVEM